MNKNTLSKRKILIVDDDDNTRELLRLSFTKAEYTVSTAINGREGLKNAQNDPPDIVLSDVVMPKMDGYELCRELKQHPATLSIPVILLTARGDSESTVEGFQAGADDYISKPFNTKEVLVRVERALRWTGQKSENAPKISGSLDKTPLFELIGFCEEHRISGIVHLARWVEDGELSHKAQSKIHLNLGEIIAIQLKDIDDVTDALDELLEWPDGTFTIEQEELHLPAAPVKAVDDIENVIEEPQVAEQKPESLSSSHIQESIHRVLDELKIQSGDLDYAEVVDSNGTLIHAVGTFAQTKSPAIRETLVNVVQFSERVSRDLDLGPLTETILQSESGLMLLYPIENFGTMSVVAPKENQGMMRWNCSDALQSISEIISS